MSYTFQPMTDEELNKPDDLVEDGVYNFEVLKSTRDVSKAGNPMAVLNIRYWDKEGQTHNILDYLTFSNKKFNIRKIKNFCNAVGIPELFNKGELPEEFKGYSGHMLVLTQKGGEIPFDKLKGKPPGSVYPDRNVVDDYVIPMSPQPSFSQPIKSKDDFVDSDLPF